MEKFFMFIIENPFVFCSSVSGIIISVFIGYYIKITRDVANEYKARIENFTPIEGCRHGTVFGYKNLVWEDAKTLVSPRYKNCRWEIGKWVYADEIPTPLNENGIYIVKNPLRDLRGYEGNTFLIESNGWYVEHEFGFRVFAARIVDPKKNQERIKKGIKI